MAITVLASGSMSKASFRPARRLGLAQEGQQFAHLAQVARRWCAPALQRHAHGHALHRAEQVDQARASASARRRRG